MQDTGLTNFISLHVNLTVDNFHNGFFPASRSFILLVENVGRLPLVSLLHAELLLEPEPEPELEGGDGVVAVVRSMTRS